MWYLDVERLTNRKWDASNAACVNLMKICLGAMQSAHKCCPCCCGTLLYRRMRYVTPVIVLIFSALSFLHARGQVMQNTNYEQELKHAQSLLAGATSTDIAHHIHYDLKLYDRDGHESTATYDIYRDPIMYQRIEVKSGNYELTRISNLRDHVDWQHYTGDMPLKIADFEHILIIPQAAVDRFAQEPQNIKPMTRQELEDAPLLCASDEQGT